MIDWKSRYGAMVLAGFLFMFLGNRSGFMVLNLLGIGVLVLGLVLGKQARTRKVKEQADG
jgi:hypothetical protein